MLYVGVDLHKQSISLCVVKLAGRERKIIERRRFRCDEEESMADYFAELGEYQLVVEATASYEWFVQLVEPTADWVVLAHPGHLRVIAQSKRKTDKLDAVMANLFENNFCLFNGLGDSNQSGIC